MNETLTATVTFDDHSTSIRLTGVAVDAADSYVVPCGVITLGERHIRTDPPLPEELTNAIGEMLDHLEDAKRELPALVEASTVAVAGPIPVAIAAIEIGATTVPERFVLTRDAAEDVFRTVATENRADRRHNPGLPADLVGVIVGGCCAVVGLIRGLQRDSLDVLAGGGAT